MHQSDWRASRLFLAVPIRHRSLSALEDAMMNEAENGLEESHRKYDEADDGMCLAPNVGVC